MPNEGFTLVRNKHGVSINDNEELKGDGKAWDANGDVEVLGEEGTQYSTCKKIYIYTYI